MSSKKYIKIDPKTIARVGKEEVQRALKKTQGAVKPVKGSPASKAKPEAN